MNLRKATYTKNGERKVSKKAYGDFFDHNGVRRRLPLFASEKNSAEALRAIQRLVSVRASDDILTPELQRFVENTLPRIRQKLVDWEIIDASLMTTAQTLAELVEEWAVTFSGNGLGEDYRLLKTSRVRNLFRDGKMIRRWKDITPENVRKQLTRYREAETNPISVATSNHYLQAVCQFCRWMVDEKKRALVSPLAAMKPLDTGGKIEHDRRAMSIEEFHCLIGYLDDAPDVMTIPADHRALIYTFGVETGLRFGLIKRLAVKRIQTHEGKLSVYVPKNNRIKYSADRWVPLSAVFWSLIKPIVEGRGPNELVFKMPGRGHGAKMVKRDLDAARQRWIEAAASPKERARREASDFLRYRDSDGVYLDFHGLRHTRAVWLFQHHGAKPRDVQELLGLGSLSLVDRYSRSFKGEHGDLVNRGPDLRPKADRAGTAAEHTTTIAPNQARTVEPKSLPTSLPTVDDIQQLSANFGEQKPLRISADAGGQNAAENPDKSGVLTPHDDDVILKLPLGEVAERLNAPVSKTG